MDANEALLRSILMTLSRQAFSPDEIARILGVGAGGKKQIAAYNLCDGKMPQSEICKHTGIDKGNLSRSIARWVEAGIVFRVGPDELPLHAYPLPKNAKAR